MSTISTLIFFLLHCDDPEQILPPHYYFCHRYYGDMKIPEGMSIEDAQGRESESHLPSTVRTLRSRWKPGMNFGDFSNATFAAFYSQG